MKYVAISFVYGYALPILFPITLIALINQYLTDKILLAYYYKKPPSYDQKITKFAIKILKFPVFMGIVLMTYLSGNRQIFNNDVNVIEYSYQPHKADHYIFRIWNNGKINQFILFNFGIILIRQLIKNIRCPGFKTSKIRK